MRAVQIMRVVRLVWVTEEEEKRKKETEKKGKRVNKSINPH